MNVQPVKINFNNKIYEVTFKSIDSEKPTLENNTTQKENAKDFSLKA